MASQLLNIPVSPIVPSQIMTITLDGRPFVFRFWWNQRAMRWFYDLSLPNGTPIQTCKGLCTGADPLRQVRARPEAPQGVLAVVDTTGAHTEPSLTSIGGRHRVVYFQETSAQTRALEAPALSLPPSIGV